MAIKAGLMSAAAIAVLAGAAHAQTDAQIVAKTGAQAEAQPKAGAVDEVVVTGQRRVNANAIATKRSDIRIVESASADEIGRLPDFNAADALKRLPGLNVMLYQGEPRFVSIRGLDANYTSVTIDGFIMATPDPGGRQVYMEVLPSDLASRIDVMKTSSADMDAHGLGGVINFVSSSAFDHPNEHVVLSARAGENLQKDSLGGTTPVGDAEASLSTLFGSTNQFGIIVKANYWLRNLHIPQIFVNPTIGFFDNTGKAAPAYGGNGIEVPLARQWYNYTDDRYREGGSTRLDWRPDKTLSADLSAFYYFQNETSYRNDSLGATAATTTDLLQTPTSGQLNNASQTYRLTRLYFNREMYGVNGAITKTFSNDLVGEVRAGWSGSRLHNPQESDAFVQSGLTFNYVLSGGLPLWTPTNLANYQNQSLYKFSSRIEQNATLDEDVYDLQGSLGRNMGADALGLGFKLGARWVRTDQANAASQITYTGATYTLADVATGQRVCSFLCNDGGIILLSRGVADQLYLQNKASLKAAVNAATSGGNYDLTEDVASGFALLQYAGPWGRIAGGVRYEHTHFNSDGFAQAGGVYQPATLQQDYGDLLPSINLTLNARADSLVRVAFSQTIARPRFDAIATHGGVLNAAVSPATLSQGNPDLKPLKSNNYDLAYEWYFDRRHGMLSVGAFYKDISDAIFSFGQLETLPINNVPSSVLVTQSRNASGITRTKGIEFALTRDLDFLPAPLDGFGVSANATFSATSFPITLSDGTKVKLDTLPQQARNIYNVALYYESPRLHAKLAWNHTGRQWDDRFSNFVSQATFYQNRYVEPLDSVDFHAAYSIRSGIAATVDVLNITAPDIVYTFGRSQEAIHDRIGFAPSVLFGLTFKR